MKRRRQVSPNTDQGDSNTGSPATGGPVFIAVGRLRRPHGVQGEIVMDVLTDFPRRLRAGKTVYIGDAHESIRLAGVRGHDQALIVRFPGIDTPEDVGRFRNAMVFVKAAELPKLPEGEYYHHQLLGLSVVDEAGQPLGVLTEILETGANDVYVVKSADGKETLLPAIEEIILEVNLDRGEMRARPPEWL